MYNNKVETKNLTLWCVKFTLHFPICVAHQISTRLRDFRGAACLHTATFISRLFLLHLGALSSRSTALTLGSTIFSAHNFNTRLYRLRGAPRLHSRLHHACILSFIFAAHWIYTRLNCLRRAPLLYSAAPLSQLFALNLAAPSFQCITSTIDLCLLLVHLPKRFHVLRKCNSSSQADSR